ncbi:MAG: hypothetical protein ACOX88_07815 [Christensenellales bacterium]
MALDADDSSWDTSSWDTFEDDAPDSPMYFTMPYDTDDEDAEFADPADSEE